MLINVGGNFTDNKKFNKNNGQIILKKEHIIEVSLIRDEQYFYIPIETKFKYRYVAVFNISNEITAREYLFNILQSMHNDEEENRKLANNIAATYMPTKEKHNHNYDVNESVRKEINEMLGLN